MSTSELIFYTNPMSRGRMVRWMLEEVGQPYQTEVLNYSTTMKEPAYLAINPMGKVPALRHRDVVVTETAAICAYLADAFPQAGLAPALNDALRGSYYRWLFFTAGPYESAVSNRALGFVVPEDRKKMMGYPSFELVIDALETLAAQGDYLLGERFSAVDVYVGSQIGFGLMFGTIDKRPAFEAYWERVSARPAAVRAAAIDDALIKSGETA